jgi:uncharacterized membrane protein
VSSQGFRPDLTIAVALFLLVGSSVLFLALLQRVTDRLRPRTLYGAVVREGIRAARETYPAALGQDAPPERSASADPEAQRVRLPGHHPGVVTSFDRDALVGAATRSGAVIEVVTAVGEYAGPGQVLLNVHGGDESLDAGALARYVVVEIRQYGASSVQVCRRLRAALEDLRATTPQSRHAGLDAHVARLDDAVARDAVIDRLRERGIDSKDYLPSIHLFPHIRELGYREGQFPVAEATSAHSMALPFFPRMSEGQVERVCAELAAAVDASRRGPGPG